MSWSIHFHCAWYCGQYRWNCLDFVHISCKAIYKAPDSWTLSCQLVLIASRTPRCSHSVLAVIKLRRHLDGRAVVQTVLVGNLFDLEWNLSSRLRLLGFRKKSWLDLDSFERRVMEMGQELIVLDTSILELIHLNKWLFSVFWLHRMTVSTYVLMGCQGKSLVSNSDIVFWRYIAQKQIYFEQEFSCFCLQ